MTSRTNPVALSVFLATAARFSAVRVGATKSENVRASKFNVRIALADSATNHNFAVAALADLDAGRGDLATRIGALRTEAAALTAAMGTMPESVRGTLAAMADSKVALAAELDGTERARLGGMILSADEIAAASAHAAAKVAKAPVTDYQVAAWAAYAAAERDGVDVTNGRVVGLLAWLVH